MSPEEEKERSMESAKHSKEVDALTAKTAAKLLTEEKKSGKPAEKSAGAKAKAGEKSAGAKAKAAEKSAGTKAKVGEKSAGTKAKAAEKKAGKKALSPRKGMVVGGSGVESHLICQIPTYLL